MIIYCIRVGVSIWLSMTGPWEGKGIGFITIFGCKVIVKGQNQLSWE